MNVDLLIFSKDRPAQLELLLRSMEASVTGCGKITVLFLSSSAEIKIGYDIVKGLYPTVEFVDEKDFRDDVLTWLRDTTSRAIAMFVDDIVVRDRIDLETVDENLAKNPDVLCYSPRLGLNLKYCYTLDKPQSAPNGQVVNGIFAWQWMSGVHDWSYMMSVDGHVFRRDQLEAWISHLNFRNPNTFEAAMQSIPWHFDMPRFAICDITSRLVNIPANRVQEVFDNRSAGVSVTEMNSKFCSGMRLAKSVCSTMNTACHEERELTWENA